uniref:Putative secreted peptide n=1 Tax=Anopheles braziliensis TaxID=58242 RepID=A0A2M3ZQR6_9DIPT
MRWPSIRVVCCISFHLSSSSLVTTMECRRSTRIRSGTCSRVLLRWVLRMRNASPHALRRSNSFRDMA